MDRLQEGYFRITNPYNRQSRIVSASPRNVHTIVFWSKNYGPFLNHRIGERLMEKGYHLFFHFTINSTNRFLEPGVPDLEIRLSQLKQLAMRFGPSVICWRFDPICFFTVGDGPVGNNLVDFHQIADHAASCGIRNCMTSFMQSYRKVRKRCASGTAVKFMDPPLALKAETLLDIQAKLSSVGIQLFTCCEKELLDDLTGHLDIKAGACISSRQLEDLFGGQLSRKRDTGQRVAQGCNCRSATAFSRAWQAGSGFANYASITNRPSVCTAAPAGISDR